MRILAIKLSSLGDLFHILPAVHGLKTQLNAEVDLVTQTEYVELARCFPDISRIISFSRRRFLRSYTAFKRDLRRSEYDMVVDFQGLLKSAIVAAMANGKRRIGPSFHREGSWLFYTEIAGRRNKNRHAVEENMDVLRHLGLNADSPVFNVRFPLKSLAEPRPRVAIAPVSRWNTKTWSAERFGDVARRLVEECGATVYLLGGSEDAGVCENIRSAASGSAINLAGTCKLYETGGILKQMDVLLSNDSGLVHMAAALGIPSAVIFGPTDPKRTGPYGRGHRPFSAGLSCQPCLSRDCIYGSARCLDGVTVETVISGISEMLRTK